MMKIDLGHEVEVNRLMDRLAEQQGLDGPEWYAAYDALRAQAEDALAKTQRGEVTTTTWLVVSAQHTLGYAAVEVTPGVDGCLHTVSAALRDLSRAEAVAEHRRNCLGW